jgi:hypothetical protein
MVNELHAVLAPALASFPPLSTNPWPCSSISFTWMPPIPRLILLATAEIPDELEREQIETSDLPANWRESPSPPALARFGDDFATPARCCLLLAPSALAVTEKNYLINPQHADSQKILVGGVEPLIFDPRMFNPQRRRAHKSK